MTVMSSEEYLAHIGVLRRSGRYPWGSGGNVESARGFQAMVKDLTRQGMTFGEIAESLGMNSTELRRAKTIARNEVKAADAAMAYRLQEKGYSNGKIAERMGLAGESSVRALLKDHIAGKLDALNATANLLRDNVDQKEIIDIGLGVERHLGVSRDKLKTAIAMLKDEGYKVQYLKTPQLGTNNQFTTTTVLTPGSMTYSELLKKRDNVRQIMEYSNDGGKTWMSIQPPISVSSKRLQVKYGAEGAEADGLVYIRPGAKDLSMGGNTYSQVRIAVDGTHFIKGMAILKDDLPAGVDMVFHTPKKDTGDKLDALKKLDWDLDPNNPFGSAISRQLTERDKDGNEKLTSAVNMVNEAGKWDEWSRNLPTQVLSKQPTKLIIKQVDKTYEKAQEDLAEIKALTNPVVRKHLLEKFADEADSSAVTLKAAAIKGQSTHVILPIPSMKDTEVYAQNFKSGDRVVLIRFPHGGIFEIPELTVNNNQPDAKKVIGNAVDAIGINANVAKKLSGADFDGDTVLVIPNNNRDFKSKPPLEKLKDFEARDAYPQYEGMKVMTKREKGIQMGMVSNLITDMTLKGASDDELAAAVKHAMVVIDAEKHKLNFRQSAIDNGISRLMKKYQDRSGGGASTLISRQKSTMDVPERKQGYKIDPKTGKKIYTPSGNKPWVNKEGKTIYPMSTVKKLAETDDAYTLTSGGSKRKPGTVVEDIYANHSNRMKALGNEARKELVRTKTPPAVPASKKAYAKEVASLNAKLDLALRNAPLERQAQIVGNAIFKQKRAAMPDMEDDEVNKFKYLALKEARFRTGADKIKVDITPEEWEAIQAGAVSPSKLSDLLRNTDLKIIKEYATPRATTSIPNAKLQRAQQMLSGGATYAEIADALGVPLSTLKDALTI